jgi:hypothetical protein
VNHAKGQFASQIRGGKLTQKLGQKSKNFRTGYQRGVGQQYEAGQRSVRHLPEALR